MIFFFKDEEVLITFLCVLNLFPSGSSAKHFCWSMGVRLQACVSHLEEWVSSVGLEAQYLRVSERLLSLVDLLATSRHTLLRVSSPLIYLFIYLLRGRPPRHLQTQAPQGQ